MIRRLPTRLIKPNLHVSLSHWRRTTASLETSNLHLLIVNLSTLPPLEIIEQMFASFVSHPSALRRRPWERHLKKCDFVFLQSFRDHYPKLFGLQNVHNYPEINWYKTFPTKRKKSPRKLEFCRGRHGIVLMCVPHVQHANTLLHSTNWFLNLWRCRCISRRRC